MRTKATVEPFKLKIDYRTAICENVVLGVYSAFYGYVAGMAISSFVEPYIPNAAEFLPFITAEACCIGILINCRKIIYQDAATYNLRSLVKKER